MSYTVDLKRGVRHVAVAERAVTRGDRKWTSRAKCGVAFTPVVPRPGDEVLPVCASCDPPVRL